VVICRRQQFGFLVGYPLVAFTSATVGAVSVSARMKLVLFVSTDRTLAPIMMHTHIARVAVAQFFKNVAAILITHCSACPSKHHLLQFLGYLTHFLGGLAATPTLTFGWWSGADIPSSSLFYCAQGVFLSCANPRHRQANAETSDRLRNCA
jgi:hypothetical protein